jgi:hypothetical protein
MADTLVIIDYSGTLSTGSVVFGRPERLRRELHLSGLAEFGVGEADVYWERIVTPTWVQGSTSPIGYRIVMQEAVAAMQPEPLTDDVAARIAAAVDVFVHSYLQHSRIDERWRPLLLGLSRNTGARVVIATDHYVEATAAILQYLGEWRIGAVAAWELWEPPRPGSFLVANSADLGVNKAEADFWDIVKRSLAPESYRAILVVDDFGCNEQPDDRYAQPERVARRRESMVARLAGVFPEAVVDVLPFVVGPCPSGNARDLDVLFDPLIEQTAAQIEEYVAHRA